MGTRINYELFFEANKAPTVVLFSNSSHNVQDPEKVFAELAEKSEGVTSLVEQLLQQRYETASGNHRAGDRMFWIDSEPGDREMVISARVVYKRGNVPCWKLVKSQCVDIQAPEAA